MIIEKIRLFCNKAIWFISLVLVSLLFCLNFWYTAVISYDTYEKVTITETAGRGIWFVISAFFAVLLTAVLHKYLKKTDEKKLFWFFAGVYAVMGAYLIFNSDTSLRSDPLMVYDAAKKFTEGSMEYFVRGKYLHSYPHQTGLMLYNALLQCFGKSTSFNFFVNLGLVIGINYVSLKTADMLFEDKQTNVITICFGFAFLPQLFFIMFAYGLIPGLFFMSLGIYWGLKLVRTGRWLCLIPMSVFSGLAVLVRKNYIIGVIALVIYILIRSGVRFKVRWTAAVCVLLCALLPIRLILLHFETKTGNDLDNGVPSVMWIAMGTDLHNKDRAPGWYNGFNYYTYINEGYDSKAAEEIGRKRFYENMTEIRNNPEKAFEFFEDKTVSMWCENTYQSLWSGPLAVCGQNTYTEFLQDVYSGGESESRIAYYCEWISQTLWLFAFVFLLCGRRRDGWQIFFLFFAGGLLFHTFWEGKSQYIYPYVYCLIPCASYGFCRCADAVRPMLIRLKNKALTSLDVP